MDPQNRSCRISENFNFFSCFIFFWRKFSQERGFGGVLKIQVFSCFHRNFSPEFLPDRNYCICTRFLRIPPDSSRFLIPLKAVWLGQGTNSLPTSFPTCKLTCSPKRSKAPSSPPKLFQALPSTPTTPQNMFYLVQYNVILQLSLNPKS